MPSPHARAPPTLPDELIEEILLRVHPNDPASLIRFAAAGSHWHRLVGDPAFRRRRLELHRGTPCMLGFLCDGIWAGAGRSNRHPSARFVPTCSFLLLRPPPRAAADDLRGLRPMDARHGRVLFHSAGMRSAAAGGSGDCFIVWNPITDQRVELPASPPWLLEKRSMKATVLCAAAMAATGVCDHLNCCHHGAFAVILVGTGNNVAFGNRNTFSCVYSSEFGAWSNKTYYDHRCEDLAMTRSALVGNALFFALRNNHDRILEYDLGTKQMSMIRLPYARTTNTNMVFASFVPELTTLEDGRLGFARVENYSELCLWSKDEGDGVKGWTLCKVSDLKNLFLPLVDSFKPFYHLVGFAESVCVAFVAVQGGLFTVDMKSGLMKKVSEGRGICCAVPYINFWNPELEAPSKDDGQRVGISNGKGGCFKRLKS